MTRPSVQNVLDEVARLYASRSTCGRLNVGAVIHNERGTILSTGYNGTLAGQEHCNHAQDSEPCIYAVHAEQNAIAFAARAGVLLLDGQITITHAPCVACAKLVVQCGITRVRYLDEYRDSTGVNLLVRAGLEVERAGGDATWRRTDR